MHFFRFSVLIVLCLLAFNQLATTEKLKAEESGTETSRWKMNFEQFYINQKLEPATFVLD